MQTTNEVQAQLEAARAEAKKLAAAVAEHETALEDARKRVEEATSRGAFEKSCNDATWLVHLIGLAKQRAEQHAADVLNPLASQHGQALREQEAAVVLAARLESERSFASAGQLAGDAVRAIAAAVESLTAFERVRTANLSGAATVSLAPVRIDSIAAELNAKIGADLVRYVETSAAGGVLQLRSEFPLKIPQALR